MSNTELPELPPSGGNFYAPAHSNNWVPGYTAEQMRAYARAALDARDPLSRFGFEAVINPNIPAGVIRLYQDGKLVGEIQNIAAPKR